MGFIDYQGTKEDRYSDVLEFAKAQQEEEKRRIQDERAAKWVAEILKDSRYSGISVNDLIRYIIVRYKNLCTQRDEILEGSEEEQLDAERLWSDYLISVIVSHLDFMGLSQDRMATYYKTFMEKVFKLEDFTPLESHFQSLREKESYHRYFADCFDMVQEKQFWKWLGKYGQKDKEKLVRFVNTYEQLSVLLGYYLFQGIRPADSEWMKRLEIEAQVMERLREDYKRGRFKEPNYQKLQNPLFSPERSKQEKIAQPSEGHANGERNKESISSNVIADPVRKHRPQLDKAKFKQMIESQSLPDYVEACRMVRQCELPEEMDNLYQELILRIPVLQESLDKFDDVYQPDMYQFYEYYIPEALQLTSTYIEYLDVGIGAKILEETEKEVLDAARKLIIAVNDKIDEIYKFASIEIKAKAKALESVMSQDGYVDPDFKISKK